MKKKKNEMFPKDYKCNENFEAPKILIRRGKKYKLIEKLKYIYLYERECISATGTITKFYECFNDYDIRLLVYYKGESGEYKE